MNANALAAQALDAAFDEGVMWCLRILYTDYDLDPEVVNKVKNYLREDKVKQ